MFFIGPIVSSLPFGNNTLFVRVGVCEEFVKLDLRKIADSVIEQTIKIPDTKLNRTYVFTVSSYAGPGKFYSTSVIQFKPKTMFINDTGIPLYFKLAPSPRKSGLKQIGENIAKSSKLGSNLSNTPEKNQIIPVQPNEQFPYHTPSIKEKRVFISFTTKNDNGILWSPAIDIHKISYFEVVLPYNESQIVVTVNISVFEGRYFVHFYNENFFHYQIRNYTNYSFSIRETSENGISIDEGTQVDAGQCKAIFSPNDCQATDNYFVISNKTLGIDLKVNMDEVKDYGFVSKSDNSPYFETQLLARENLGLTKLLIISNSKSNDKKIPQSSENELNTRINLSLKEVGLSFVDIVPKELFYFSISNTRLEVDMSKEETKIALTLGM
jgi:hypothetical protein